MGAMVLLDAMAYKQQLEPGVWKGAVLIQIQKVSLLKGSFCGSCSETPVLNKL